MNKPIKHDNRNKREVTKRNDPQRSIALHSSQWDAIDQQAKMQGIRPATLTRMLITKLVPVEGNPNG